MNMIRLKSYIFQLVPTNMFQVRDHTIIIAQRTYLYSKNVFLPSPKEHISIKIIHFYPIPTSMFLSQECMISIHSNEHTSIRGIYLYPITIIMLLTIKRMHPLSILIKMFLFKQYTCYPNVSKHVPIQSGPCLILFQRTCFC